MCLFAMSGPNSCVCVNVLCDQSIVLILSVNDGQLAVSDATVNWLDSFEVNVWSDLSTSACGYVS